MNENDGETWASFDDFTAADRKALAEVNINEAPRTSRMITSDIVETFERREIFTFHEPTVGTICFDIRGIKNAILAGRLAAQMMHAPITEDWYQHIRDHNGVDLDRLAKLSEQDLLRPGIMILWPTDHSTLIDGNHRLCRLYELGRRKFRFLMVGVMGCVEARVCCRPGEEASLFAPPTLDDVPTNP